jgi:hypothetical protein
MCNNYEKILPALLDLIAKDITTAVLVLKVKTDINLM